MSLKRASASADETFMSFSILSTKAGNLKATTFSLELIFPAPKCLMILGEPSILSTCRSGMRSVPTCPTASLGFLIFFIKLMCRKLTGFHVNVHITVLSSSSNRKCATTTARIVLLAVYVNEFAN